MSKNQSLSRGAYLYIFAVICAGLIAIGHSAITLAVTPPPNEWLVLAALTLLTGSFSVKIPSVPAKISVSEAFVFAAVLLFGPAVATSIVALDSLVMSMWQKGHRLGVRSLFNFSAVGLAIWIASNTFFWLADVQPGNLDELLPLERHLLQLFVLASAYFLLNSWFVAIAVSLERRAHVVTLWWQHFPWFSLNYFGGVSVAALLVAYTRTVDLSALAFILPLLLIPYLTYRTSLGRIEDSMRHVEQVNELYMSTIETLAMAVDAKDQITHGHIRRVQVYALELAKRIGVTEDRQLKAIAAAALLHDMGKLAIPEHILNKPGRLSATEFDRMKQHAGLGADLLSSIRFPYPVVPIVRHHHESWDGSGYPSGIAGADIPLGARILSVVDCFDALTSDRPYRPRLSNDEAFAIIRERRGTMYDPLIVDTFIRAYPEIGPAAIKAGQEARTIFPAEDQFAVPTEPSLSLRQIRANATETALLAEFSQSIGRATTSGEGIEQAAQCLRQLIPATVFAFYRYRPESDTLVCESSFGDPGKLLDGLAIRAGQRITGWSGATKRTSVNSDAALDLAQIAEMFQPLLRSTLSVPLLQGDKLVGVLTMYSPRDGSFNDAHSHIAEQVASALSARLVSVFAAPPAIISFSNRIKSSS